MAGTRRFLTSGRAAEEENKELGIVSGGQNGPEWFLEYAARGFGESLDQDFLRRNESRGCCYFVVFNVGSVQGESITAEEGVF